MMSVSDGGVDREEGRWTRNWERCEDELFTFCCVEREEVGVSFSPDWLQKQNKTDGGCTNHL